MILLRGLRIFNVEVTRAESGTRVESHSNPHRMTTIGFAGDRGKSTVGLTDASFGAIDVGLPRRGGTV